MIFLVSVQCFIENFWFYLSLFFSRTGKRRSSFSQSDLSTEEYNFSSSAQSPSCTNSSAGKSWFPVSSCERSICFVKIVSSLIDQEVLVIVTKYRFVIDVLNVNPNGGTLYGVHSWKQATILLTFSVYGGLFS